MPTAPEDRDDLPPAGTKARHALRAREARLRRFYGKLGPYDLVPVYAARHVVKSLRKAGFTYARLEEVLDVDSRQLLKILDPATTRIRKHTHDHLMSFNVEELIRRQPPSRRLGKAPYRELLRRYLAAGWSKRELCEIAGPPLNEHSDVWRDRGTYISRDMANAIEKMHAELGERVKTRLSDRDKARITFFSGRGYAPPASYDDGVGRP